MKIKTRNFGEMEVSENSVITFVQPLYGFEEYTKFVIIENDEIPGIAWLQSYEESELCFIIISPSIVGDCEKYKKYIPKDELRKIEASENFECWLVMVAKDTIEESTVNLKSPIIINNENSSAMQIILEEDFPVRYYAFEKGKEN